MQHDYGYGVPGLPPRIPPYAVLHFEVELLSADALPPAQENAAPEQLLELPLGVLHGVVVEVPVQPAARQNVTLRRNIHLLTPGGDGEEQQEGGGVRDGGSKG